MREVENCGQPSSTALDTTNEVSIYFCHCGRFFLLVKVTLASECFLSSEADQLYSPWSSPPQRSTYSTVNQLPLRLWGPVEGWALGVK